MSRITPASVPMVRTRRPGISRARHVEELRKGRPAALRHGVFAIVANLPDVATEVALTYVSRPALDPIIDRRLVEDLALARVQRQRAAIAIDAHGMDPKLTAYESRLAALVERLERAVHERERERIRQASEQHDAIDLARYRPRQVTP